MSMNIEDVEDWLRACEVLLDKADNVHGSRENEITYWVSEAKEMVGDVLEGWRD